MQVVRRVLVLRKKRRAESARARVSVLMVRPWKAGNYLKVGNFVRFRIVGMSFRIQDKYHVGRARHLPVHIITTRGINKAASLQLLNFAKLSSIKDMYKSQTC